MYILSADSHSRLVAEEKAGTTAGLATRLNTLKVWAVQSISRSHTVEDVVGIPDTGDVLFDDSDDDRLDIYVCRESNWAVINYQLSEEFTQYCGITHEHKKLVIQILTYPLERIEKVLDEHGLSQLTDDNRGSKSNESESDESDAENTPSYKVGTNCALQLENTISRSPDHSAEPDFESPSETSFLRSRIPAFDERISHVRAAAAFAHVTPTPIEAPRQSIDILHQPTHSLGPNPNDTTPQPATRVTSSITATENLAPATSAPTEQERRTSSSTFGFGDMASVLSDLITEETGSHATNMLSAHRSFRPHLNQSPGNPRNQPNPVSTAEGVYRHYIGLQGEVFVSHHCPPTAHFLTDFTGKRMAIFQTRT